MCVCVCVTKLLCGKSVQSEDDRMLTSILTTFNHWHLGNLNQYLVSLAWTVWDKNVSLEMLLHINKYKIKAWFFIVDAQ